MILIGQYDSPFVRRVGIAMTIYKLPFEHRPWSTFGDAEKIRQFNPLVRVPTLVLENGDVLIESYAILDYLDGLVPLDQRLLPRDEPARHRALKVAAVATGTSDKAVSLFFEKKLHQTVSDLWVERCRAQIEASLRMLETDRAGRDGDHWFGDMSHADIAVAAMWRHLAEAHPDLADAARYTALVAHARRLEALPAFRLISQPFISPA